MSGALNWGVGPEPPPGGDGPAGLTPHQQFKPPKRMSRIHKALLRVKFYFTECILLDEQRAHLFHSEPSWSKVGL